MSGLYWLTSFQQEGKVWQRVIQKIVKASVQVTMSAISVTRFLDPVFPPKTLGTDFLSSDIVWLNVGQGFQNPCCNFGSCSSCHCFLRPGRRDIPNSPYTTHNFRNKLILDWSIARTHHKCSVETLKRGGPRSNGATTTAPNH